jgi:hypothetical protein
MVAISSGSHSSLLTPSFFYVLPGIMRFQTYLVLEISQLSVSQGDVFVLQPWTLSLCAAMSQLSLVSNSY